MRSILVTLGLTCLCVSLARADFTPITLDPASFNQDPVIERIAPPVVQDFVTITADSGTNKLQNTIGTWYEKGFNTVNATSGFPVHASLVAKTNTYSGSIYTFQMPPDYHTNNCFFLGHHGSANPNWQPIVTGPVTITLKTPAPFNSLSVLCGSSSNCVIGFTVHYANGNTLPGTFTTTDWFNNGIDAFGSTRMFDATGTISMSGGINFLSVNKGVVWAKDINGLDTANNVTSIDFNWQYGGTQGHSPWGYGRTMIFGLAGSTDGVNFTPLPVSGFNQDVIYEADAPATWGSGNNAVAGILTNGNTYCTVTMDGAYAKTGSTWYEKGYCAALPNTGLPTAGSTITSIGRPYISYKMPSTYATNCAYYLSVAVSNATVKLATPTAAGSLAFLAGGGNSGIWIRVELGFQGGGSETNWIFAPDWFTRDTQLPAYVCFGRVAPSVRAVNNSADTFNNAFMPPNLIGIGPQPFSRDPRLTGNGQLAPNTPGVRLYDLVMPVANSGAAISTINLVATNTTTADAAIFAVSAGPGMPPIITTQPIGLVTDSATGTPIVTNGAAVFNDIRITKGYQGTNNISLITSNYLTTGVSYQWKKAPRGGGYRDLYDTFDMSTFANVSGPNIGGATSPILTISNATLADTGDYLLVASNQYGSQTSFVATVMVLTTNYSLLVGAGNGDTITKYTADGTSANGQETFTSANDQVQQKWLSTGLGGIGLDGVGVAQATVPFVGPVGYIVTPVAGASFVNSIRFYCANDSSGRDPRDYSLEGSNDGSSWTPIANGQLLGTLMLPGPRGGTGTTPLNPMTQNLLEVDFANSTAYKSYRLTITNCMEPVFTPLMQVAEIQLLGSFVPAPPIWVRQPVPTMTVFVGSAPTFTASATGLGALAPRYQWYRSPSTQIAGATRSSYTLTNPQLADSGASFYCVAANNSGQITSTSGTLTVIPAPTQPYPAAVLANSPMGYWRLDEPDNGTGNSGVLTHDYVGGHNGTYSTVLLSVEGYNSASDTNTAAQFGTLNTMDSLVDNINDVDFARSSGNATFSIEAWVFGTTPISGNPAIVTKGYNGILNTGTGTGTEQFAIDYTLNTGFRFLVRNAVGQGYQAQSTVNSVSDPLPPFNAAWHHLVGVCDQPNGNLYLYVDGLLAATGTIATNSGIETQTLPMTIGSRKSTQVTNDYDQNWVGTIDDVAIYPSVLTASQVFTHYYAAQRPPLMTLNPTNVTIADNVPVTFYSSAYGPGTLHYQWYQSDGNSPIALLSGQTSSNAVFTTSPALHTLFYQVVVTSQYGSVTSAPAQLFVVSGSPQFLQDLPSIQTVYVGHILRLHVVPGGTAPFTYQWYKDSVALADNYRTSGSKTDTLTIGYATNTDSGTYVVILTGQGANSSTADVITVTTNSISFFNAGSTGWTLNGGATLNGNSVQLTVGAGSTARSAFLATKQNISSFSGLGFTYQDVSGAGGADGATFCIQNLSDTALGGGGGSLGYSTAITPSFALAFNIYASNTRGIDFLQNGVTHAAGANAYHSILPNVGVGDNTNAILVVMNYDGAVLTATLKDTVTGLSVTTNYTVNLPSLLGSSTAWVGFTGADGGTVSTQTMSWGTTAGGTGAPFALTSKRVGSNIILSWPAQNGAILFSSPTVGPAVWTPATDPWQVVGSLSAGTAQVTVTPSSGVRFFRLQVFP